MEPLEVNADLTFCTTDFPRAKRMEMWRELVASAVFGQDMTPADPLSFFARASCLPLGIVDVVRGTSSDAVYRRTPRLIAADGNDDFVFAVNLAGRLEVTDSLRHSRSLAGVGATGFHCGKPVTLSCLSCSDGHPYGAVSLRIPRMELRRRAPHGEKNILGCFSGTEEPLRLLMGYLRMFGKAGTPIPKGELAQLAGSHILDLVTLMVGPTRDTRWEASQGGLRAARLSAVQSLLGRDFQDHELSVRKVAGALGISERYVQNLMAETGESFTETVNRLRLEHAQQMLGEPRYRHWRVSDVAFASGFSDLAYFHRLFRRRFGDSPGNFRTGIKRNDHRRTANETSNT
ncbi:AraC family transcriptional regulator [Methylococcus mesophilus]|uniref:AraC family transcriptional regulator n=1 Tax=Methylococcus mesophilus TaxID=2993564 RepID=UPI00224ACB55|nr:AraC family transcriptional regulator [Methylococcus mesophilus]UZR27708.1 AraC family transcriptional regulator [Methylococcus mesophilus]